MWSTTLCCTNYTTRSSFCNPGGCACAPMRSSHLQPLHDGLDAGVGPNGSIERVLEREIDSTDVRRGALNPPLDRRLPVAKPHEGVGDQVFSNVLRVRTLERLP